MYFLMCGLVPSFMLMHFVSFYGHEVLCLTKWSSLAYYLQAIWQKLIQGRNGDGQDPLPMPSRLVTDDDLEPLYQILRISEASAASVKRKGDISLDTQHYGRGKRAREVGWMAHMRNLIMLLVGCSLNKCCPVVNRYDHMKTNGLKKNLRNFVRLIHQVLQSLMKL